MHEHTKIQEARYFLGRMKDSSEIAPFQYELSAFLSAARSALQYALKEAKSKTGGKAWYDSAVTNNRIVNFFKDKRDISVHHEPVVPNKDVTISIGEVLHFSEAVQITVYDREGRLVSQGTAGCPFPPPQPPKPASVSYRFWFSDWADQDLMELCVQYLSEIQSTLEDGIEKGFLPEQEEQPNSN
jgi:hypothetical protein